MKLPTLYSKVHNYYESTVYQYQSALALANAFFLCPNIYPYK